jgi:hypothetical protein
LCDLFDFLIWALSDSLAARFFSVTAYFFPQQKLLNARKKKRRMHAMWWLKSGCTLFGG